MLGHYDRWKLADGDDPGHGPAIKIPLLRCTQCDWRGTFTDAVGHFRQTDHALTFRGTKQDFEKYRVTADELAERR